MKIRLSGPLEHDSIVNGYGLRAVLWTQGCLTHCKGCQNPETWDLDGGFEVDTEEVKERLRAFKGQAGITFCGGEPFAQNTDLMKVFLSSVRTTGLSVMAYTGFLREDLEADEGKRDLLEFIDVLVDGPYVEGEDHGELWRGSSNQRIHFLTTRYSHFGRTVERKKGRPLEIEFGKGASFTFSGIPPKGFRGRLEDGLRRKGFVIDW